VPRTLLCSAESAAAAAAMAWPQACAVKARHLSQWAWCALSWQKQDDEYSNMMINIGIEYEA
jgi:hypothetical protein